MIVVIDACSDDILLQGLISFAPTGSASGMQISHACFLPHIASFLEMLRASYHDPSWGVRDGMFF